jgi:GMP synthase (glutamine-hydrolysing)
LSFILIDCGSSATEKIGATLEGLGCVVQTVLLEAANKFPFTDISGIVISGGPHLFTEVETGERLKRRFKFIESLTLPILGICLGHQALGLSAGVEAYRGKERRDQETLIKVKDHPLLEGLPAEFSLRVDHCEGIPLPEGYELLAYSEAYPVEIMASQTLPHFGVQSHPEISGDSGRQIFKNFYKIVRAHSSGANQPGSQPGNFQKT